MISGNSQARKVAGASMKQIQQTNSKKSLVFVVDDEESIRDTFDVFLSEAGYDVVMAKDGPSAVAMARNQDFDVAVVDRILPGNMSGIDVIRDIKKVLPFCETILMSAYPSFESAAQLMEHETVAYLTKPVQQEEICRVVAFAAEKSRLKKEHARYESILQAFFDSSPNPIIVYDSLLHVQFVNPAFLELFEYSREDVLDQPMLFVPEDETPALRQEFQRLLQGETIREHEQKMAGKNGKLMDTSRIISLGAYLQGGAATILVIIRNITEEKKQQALLVESEKLALLGHLAAKLAHEIKNPVQVITGFAELLQREDLRDDVKSRISLMADAAFLISGLTADLMEVARPKPLRMSTFCIEQPLEKAAQFLLSIGETKYLKVLKHYACDTLPIQGDFNQLEQVCMNLIINASQAMQGIKEKTIRLETDYDSEKNVVHLSVQDAGCGIAPENMEKIFDPFFSTKEHGVSNGLGLPVVKQIVDCHGGRLTVESQPGQGATFIITLPLAPAEVQAERNQSVV